MCFRTSEWNPYNVFYSPLFPRRPKRSKIRVRRLTNRRRRSRRIERDVVVMKTKMELNNLKLYLENRSIMEENGMLRKKAQLLHQENRALMYQLIKKFSKLEEDFSSLGFLESSVHK